MPSAVHSRSACVHQSKVGVGLTGLRVPSQGLTDVETTLLHFPVSVRDGGPPAGAGLVSRVSSPTTSLTLRSGGVEVKVNSGSGSEILLATKVSLGSPDDPPICGLPQAACDSETRALREQVQSKLEVCSALGKRALSRSRRQQFDACVAELTSLEANMTLQADSCAALPAPCNGRGNCTAGICSCEESWYGVACSVQPSCRYWDGNQLPETT